MDLDLIYVAYNSHKWIRGCFDSVRQSDYDLKKLHIYVLDNASKDDTVKDLKEIKGEYGSEFGAFEIIESRDNLGFGRGNNEAFKKGTSKNVCFINIDTHVYEDTFKNLKKEIEESDDKTVLWEFRQLPYEHPKVYDVATGEVSWSSGAAFAIKRSVYEEMKGFDPRIFMYAEDVDLSFRLRAAGYRLKYVPSVSIDHYSYADAGQIKPLQYVNCVINNLLLRYRFGKSSDILRWYVQFASIMFHRNVYKGSKKQLIGAWMSHLKDIPGFRHYLVNGSNSYRYDNEWHFYGFDYEKIRNGAFYKNKRCRLSDKVTVILPEAEENNADSRLLYTVKKQTYPFINTIYSDDYKKVLPMITGDYVCVVSENTLMFYDHIEVLMAAMQESGADAAYSDGVWTEDGNAAVESTCFLFKKDVLEKMAQDAKGKVSSDRLADVDMIKKICKNVVFVEKTTVLKG